VTGLLTYPNGETKRKPSWRDPCLCGQEFGSGVCDKKGLNAEECMAKWSPYPPADVEPTPVDISRAEAETITAAFVNIAEAIERGDKVVLPEHYARFAIEPVRFICENNLNFFQGNIIKYILRWDAKNGLEDLRKAKRYLEMFIKFVEKDPNWWGGE
jgi:hypothetical protein